MGRIKGTLLKGSLSQDPTRYVPLSSRNVAVNHLTVCS